MGVQSQPQYTTLSDLANDIQKIVNTYRSDVLESIQNNIGKCGDIYISEVKKVSPVDTGEYQGSWAKKKKSRAKYVVYIGNTKKVKRKHKDPTPAIPLINIFEFSTNWRRQPHVGTAVANSKDQIINTISDGIQGV